MTKNNEDSEEQGKIEVEKSKCLSIKLNIELASIW